MVDDRYDTALFARGALWTSNGRNGQNGQNRQNGQNGQNGQLSGDTTRELDYEARDALKGSKSHLLTGMQKKERDGICATVNLFVTSIVLNLGSTRHLVMSCQRQPCHHHRYYIDALWNLLSASRNTILISSSGTRVSASRRLA